MAHAQHQWGPPRQGGGGGGKALPVAIGAGLAIGVFLGLLLIRGTGAEAKSSDEPVAATEVDAGVVEVEVDAAVAVAKVPDAAPVEPAVKKVTLTFAVTPADAEDLEIKVDGTVISGTSYSTELEPDAAPKKVKVEVRAKGHSRFRKRLTLAADHTLEVELKQRKRGHSPSGGKRPGGPGGLIDL